MANKKLNQLVTKPSIASGDLFPIADATTGQLYKTTISDLGTAIGSGVSSVNGLVGAVVLDTDDIQELASPVNKWFTDLRARAAISVSSPLAYNSGTGLITIAQATGSANGYLSSTDWTTFNSKQTALNGTGFVKASGTTISYDNTAYLPTTLTTTANTILINGQQFSIYGSTAGVYTSGRIIVDNGFSGLGYQVSGLFRGLSFDTSGNAWFDNTGSVRFYNSSVRFDGTLTNGTYTYTLPSATGTLALTSNLSAYVPYTGATGAVNLGAYDLTVNSIKVGKGGGAIADNTSVGASALNANTTGSSNTAIGYYALNANTIGGANTAIGYSSLWVNTTGGNNTAVGYNALSSNTTGGSNTALGQGSLSSNSTGANNVAVGLQSLLSNTTASNNSALGNQSLFYNTTGYSNVAVGYQSLLGNTTGRNNTAIGVGSGQYITTGILNTIVGSYGGTTTMSNNVILSDGSGNIRFQFDGTNTTLGQSGNIGIGTTPSAWGSLSSAIQLKNGLSAFSHTSGLGGIGNNVYSVPGTNDYYIATDFASRYYQYQGNHVWNTAPSGTAGTAITFTAGMTLTAASHLLVNSASDDGLGMHYLQVNGLSRATQWRSYADGQDIAYGGGFYQQSTSGTTYAVASLMGTTGQLRWWTYNPTNGFNNYMTLTNGGNLLLNTTTDAGYRLDVNGSGRFTGKLSANPSTSYASIVTGGIQLQSYSTDNNLLSFNAYFNGGADVYLNNGYANQIQANGGDFYFKVAASGTSGSAFSYSSPLVIKNSGNVGIGTTSPNRALHVVGGIELTSDLVSTKGGTTFRLGYDAYTTTSGVNLFTESAVPLVFGTSSSERMRIKSNGIINFSNVPTSSAGLSSGDVYKTVAGVLMIV